MTPSAHVSCVFSLHSVLVLGPNNLFWRRSCLKNKMKHTTHTWKVHTWFVNVSTWLIITHACSRALRVIALSMQAHARVVRKCVWNAKQHAQCACLKNPRADASEDNDEKINDVLSKLKWNKHMVWARLCYFFWKKCMKQRFKEPLQWAEASSVQKGLLS